MDKDLLQVWIECMSQLVYNTNMEGLLITELEVWSKELNSLQLSIQQEWGRDKSNMILFIICST